VNAGRSAQKVSRHELRGICVMPCHEPLFGRQRVGELLGVSKLPRGQVRHRAWEKALSVVAIEMGAGARALAGELVDHPPLEVFVHRLALASVGAEVCRPLEQKEHLVDGTNRHAVIRKSG